MDKQVMINVDGKPFRCPDCSANVFTEYRQYHYRCNGCGAFYVGNNHEKDEDEGREE